jgi:lipid II:glycine glycyltransferase (peptidoglycan interpeptide bridge formation enzyme)
LESLALTKLFTKKHRVREELATHTRHEIRATTRTQVAIRAHNTTRRVYNSNRALIAITKNQMRGIKVLVLRNALRMLGVHLHAPRGPFYSPKAARSR